MKVKDPSSSFCLKKCENLIGNYDTIMDRHQNIHSSDFFILFCLFSKPVENKIQNDDKKTERHI